MDLVIRRAQRDAIENPGQADAYVRLARGFLRKRRETANPVHLAYAKDAIYAAQQISPRAASVIALDIIARFDAHEFRAAEKRANELIAAAPDDPTGHLLLGDALLELGEYERAVEAYQSAMDRHPDLRSYSRAAYMRWLHGDFEGSLELWEDALGSASARDPEPAAWCYAELGAMLLSQGNPRAALGAALSADKLVPGYVPALVLRGRALAKLGRTSGAITALQTAVDRQPSAETLLVLSEQLSNAGRTADAAAQLTRAERQADHDPLPVALFYARHGIHTERAVQLAKQAIDDRKSIWAYDALALAQLRAGELVDAKVAIDRALARGTPRAELHLHRGLIADAFGDSDTARASLQAARAIDASADPLVAAELADKLGAESTLAMKVTR